MAQAMLHAEQGFPPRLRGVRGEEEAGVRRRLMDRFAHLRVAVLRGAASQARARGRSLGAARTSRTRTATTRMRSASGWSRTSAARATCIIAPPRTPDVRSIALLREVFAYHAGPRRLRLRHAGPGQRRRSRWPAARSRRRATCRRRRAGDAIAAFALSEPDAGSDVAGDDDARAKQKATTGCSTAPRPGSPTAASPTSTSCSRKADGGHQRVRRRCEGASTRRERIDIVAPHPDGDAEASRTAKGDAARRGRAGLQAGDAQPRHLPHHGRRARRSASRAARWTRRSARAKDRKMFGQTLADFQLTQAKLADMATGIDAARAAHLPRRLEQGRAEASASRARRRWRRCTPPRRRSR